MKNLNKIAKELFNQIRSRFSDVTIGNEEADVTNEPETARYFDFMYSENDEQIGNVSVSLDEEEGLVVMFSNNFGEGVSNFQKDSWYSFLKELRVFAKKRLLNFEVRDINKSSLQRRDYKSLAKNRSGEKTMSESKMYGTHKTSFQKIGNAKLAIKHVGSLAEDEKRTKKIGSIFIENSEGEKFKYPFKHLAGARAMAVHVSEGGHPFDDFGKHITSMSEELSNLRKFKTYMGRSSVMAESLAEHIGTVNERMKTVRKTIQSLQKPSLYAEAIENFVAEEAINVPSDVAENWIDQLTVKQFNEELKDVFPYIYKLVSESTKANELTFEDIFTEDDVRTEVRPGEKDLIMLGRRFSVPSERMQDFIGDMIEVNGLDDASLIGVDEVIVPSSYAGIQIGASPTTPGATRGIDPKDNYSKADFDRLVNQSTYEEAMESLMGQFAEGKRWKQTSMSPKDAIEKFGKNNVKIKKNGLNNGDDMIEIFVEDNTDEGNAYAHAVRQAKMNGKKKGDKVKGPDGDEITIEKEQKTPLGEFILSYFDRENGQFPKGETAVLTMVEKEYGEQYIKPAQQFIEQVNNKIKEVMGYKDDDVEEGKVGTAMQKFGQLRPGGSQGKGAAAGHMSYIYDMKDAMAVASKLRGSGKKIETGNKAAYEGNYANDYANYTWNLYQYLEKITDGFDAAKMTPQLKSGIDQMMTVRGAAKKVERSDPNNGAVANQAVEALYGVILGIRELASKNNMFVDSENLERMKNLAGV